MTNTLYPSGGELLKMTPKETLEIKGIIDTFVMTKEEFEKFWADFNTPTNLNKE